MKRRTFLKRGLMGGAVLALGGITLGNVPTKLTYSPIKPLHVFKAKHFSVMAAIAARMVTAPGADPVALAHFIDAALRRSPREVQSDILDVLELFENGAAGVFLDQRFLPFSRLSPEAQDRTLLAWRDSRISLRRGAYKALKNLTLTSYYRKESTWAQVGYPGPPPIGMAGAGTP